MNVFVDQLIKVLEKIYHNPVLLESKEVDKEIKSKLNQSCNKGGQGSANKATPHEVHFANQLEQYGFQFLGKDKINEMNDGHYYIYQINGTQKSPDFSLVDIKKNKINTRYDFDLKHSNLSTIHFNDGWFNHDMIYVISYIAKKEKSILIGFGKDIPSEQENNKMTEIRKIKEDLNKQYKESDSNLRVVFRFANQYKCNFTMEQRNIFFQSLKKTLQKII